MTLSFALDCAMAILAATVAAGTIIARAAFTAVVGYASMPSTSP
jgi:hypothetical protein